MRRGASSDDLRRAVAADAVVRLREGIYALPGAHPSVVLAAHHGGESACASALRSLGVWVLEEQPRTHVWVGPRGRVHPHPACTCITHRDGGTSAFGVVRITQALVQVARCLGAEAFFAAFESAWRQGLLTRTMRADVRASLPARLRWLTDIARPAADSGLESIVRLRFHRLGIPMVSQVPIGGVGRVDFVINGVLVLEIDGEGNHGAPRQRHRDLMRDAAAAAAGYETLRFDYTMVLYDWSVVERAVLARLEVIRGRRTR